MRIFDIGIKTREQINGDKDSASDRIRAKLIADKMDNIEIWRSDTHYSSVIFHLYDFNTLKGIRNKDGLAVYDICDHWDTNKHVVPFAKEVDIVTTCSEPLKEALIEVGVETPIHVITDGHDIQNRRRKFHNDVIKKVVWFGYVDNQHVLDDYYDFLKENNLKLRVIAERDLKKADEFFKWDVNTYYDLINECDLALLPKNGPYKTNNKDVTAWLCGLPVAKTKEDLLLLKDKWERIVHLGGVFYKDYDIVNRAWEYNNICAEYWATK